MSKAKFLILPFCMIASAQSFVNKDNLGFMCGGLELKCEPAMLHDQLERRCRGT